MDRRLLGRLMLVSVPVALYVAIAMVAGPWMAIGVMAAAIAGAVFIVVAVDWAQL